MAHYGFQGGHAAITLLHKNNSKSEPINAFPRLLTLCVNSKKAKYAGNFSFETPRCGRNHYRSNDQNPSCVLTGIS